MNGLRLTVRRRRVLQCAAWRWANANARDSRRCRWRQPSCRQPQVTHSMVQSSLWAERCLCRRLVYAPAAEPM